MSKYDEKFYISQMEESYNSAREMIKQILPLLPKINNVVDIGCGVGTWLRAWKESDKNINILGIDGNDVNEKLFHIDKENYKKINLTENYKDILTRLGFNKMGGG